MNIIFLSGLFPDKLINEIENSSKGVIQYAANTLQCNLIKGLYQYDKLKIINLPFIGSYPFLYKKSFLSTFNFEHIDGAKDINIGFFNLPVLKLFSRYYGIKRELIKTLSEKAEDTTIILYSINSPFLQSAVDTKKLFPNIKICLIVPDLPEYMSDSKNIFYRTLKKIDSVIIKKCLKKVDSFVVLTDYMADALNLNSKPWVKIEGIFEPPINNKPIIKEKNITILYTGTLARRYGIMNLINAFTNIKASDYRLWICGEGDTRKEIEKIMNIDKRILYLGQRTHEEALVLQKKATVLINPRTSEGDYTKYSFPSKTMEYLASGTPTIIHRLKGIPEEYFQYCYVAEEENADGLKDTILKVCSKDQLELNEFGRKASNFILEKKNPITQVKKIYLMLSSVANKI